MTKIRKSVLLSKVILTLLLFTALSLHNRIARSAQAYYADDYSSSNVYASVADSGVQNDLKTIQNTEKSNVVTSKATTKKGKKVYNTIIIKGRGNSNETNKTEKVEKVKASTQTSTQVSPTSNSVQMEEIKSVSTGMQKAEINRSKTTTTKKTSTSFLASKINPFYKTTTDKWYVYALATATFSGKLPFASSASLNPYLDSTETSPNVDKTQSLKSQFGYSGVGALVGGKFYFSAEPQLFIGPELFYTRLNLGVMSSKYTTKHMQYGVAGYRDTDTTTASDYFPVYLPVYIQTKPKDMFGGSLRGGITFFNTVSVFAKANIGGLRSDFTLTPNANSIDWTSDLKNLSAQQRADIITSLSHSASYAYAGVETYNNKLSLLYGVGLGIELTFWDQHVIIRLDYDHYFTNSTIKLAGTAYPRSSSQVNKVTEESDGTATPSSGREWKNKMHFGIIKVGVGIGF